MRAHVFGFPMFRDVVVASGDDVIDDKFVRPAGVRVRLDLPVFILCEGNRFPPFPSICQIYYVTIVV